MTRIIGISAFYHDSAASLIEDGVIIAAAQEERTSPGSACGQPSRNRFAESATHCLPRSL